jgi:hypothetical protein
VERHELPPRDPALRSFLGRQVHIATEHFGDMDPLDLEEYLRRGGFQALLTSLNGDRLRPFSTPSNRAACAAAAARDSPPRPNGAWSGDNPATSRP